jgi:hypothetical protein
MVNPFLKETFADGAYLFNSALISFKAVFRIQFVYRAISQGRKSGVATILFFSFSLSESFT